MTQTKSKRRFRKCATIAKGARIAIVPADSAMDVSRDIRRLFEPDAHLSGGVAADGGSSPSWDPDLGELRVGRNVVKRLPRRADAQRRILSAFEESHWAKRIDDPLPPKPGIPPKHRLNNVIKKLNMNHIAAVIRFRGDGDGEGIRWETRKRRTAVRRPRTSVIIGPIVDR